MSWIWNSLLYFFPYFFLLLPIPLFFFIFLLPLLRDNVFLTSHRRPMYLSPCPERSRGFMSHCSRVSRVLHPKRVPALSAASRASLEDLLISLFFFVLDCRHACTAVFGISSRNACSLHRPPASILFNRLLRLRPDDDGQECSRSSASKSSECRSQCEFVNAKFE